MPCAADDALVVFAAAPLVFRGAGAPEEQALLIVNAQITSCTWLLSRQTRARRQPRWFAWSMARGQHSFSVWGE